MIVRVLFIVLFFLPTILFGQEVVTPLLYNPYIQNNSIAPASKKTRASIPFIDDFSSNSTQTDNTLWVESQVYINNEMAVEPPTIGVATFDGLDANGRPYRPDNFSASGFGDSLTAQPIDLTSFSPADSLYISFYFQPQGRGFNPETNDSLYLFLKDNNGQWDTYWTRQGTNYMPFAQVLLPINDTKYFHDSFQFRFVNFTSLNLNDDVWNLDYVRLAPFRNEADSIINDIAFSQPASSILSTYQSMPYRHFVANAANELSAQQEFSINNLYAVPQTVNVEHNATETFTSSSISSNNVGNQNILARTNSTVANPSYPITFTPSSPNGAVTIRNTYYFPAPTVTDRKQNDTLIQDVIFDNYFAYDDGTAELAYFLNPALNQAARTAIKFTLNQADSVRGISVYFAPQAPSALDKFFSIVLYDNLIDNSNTNGVLHQQDLYKVQYEPGKNSFSTYAFDEPQFLQAGDYYIGITQPANFGSDSIYYGIDANNDNNINVLSYSVNGLWFNSSVQGSIMIRPIVGDSFTPTTVDDFNAQNEFSIYPNPAANKLNILAKDFESYQIISLNGSIIKSGRASTLDVEEFVNGLYLMRITSKDKTEIHKLWKQ